MDPSYAAAISGLVGALIGSVSSVATIIVQSRAKDRRDRSRQVTELSLAEFSHHLQMARDGTGPSAVAPISAFIFNNDKTLRALDDGSLSPEKAIEISLENDRYYDAINAIDQRRKDQPKS